MEVMLSLAKKGISGYVSAINLGSKGDDLKT
jgi:hypothetical protein